MAKFHIHADTDTGEYSFQQDGSDVAHTGMCVSSYMCGSFDKNGNYKENSQRRMSVSHEHVDDKGTRTSTDMAFYLGSGPDSGMQLDPTNSIPQAVAKLVETATAAKILEKSFNKNK